MRIVCKAGKHLFCYAHWEMPLKYAFQGTMDAIQIQYTALLSPKIPFEFPEHIFLAQDPSARCAGGKN